MVFCLVKELPPALQNFGEGRCTYLQTSIGAAMEVHWVPPKDILKS